jgi:hypothetical protein
MRGVRISLLALVACLCLAPSARADFAGPWPWSRKPLPPWGHYGAPPPGWFETEKQMEALRREAAENGTPPPASGGIADSPGPAQTTTAQPTREQPRRTGPFRSCGSGMGVGLAGIGLAWGLMWAGTRFAGRVARPK